MKRHDIIKQNIIQKNIASGGDKPPIMPIKIKIVKGEYEMSEELESLLAQRREIDAQIKKLRNKTVLCKRAKYEVEHFTSGMPDEHVVRVSYTARSSRPKWSTVIRNRNKDEIIPEIQEVIDSLTKLKEKLEAE